MFILIFELLGGSHCLIIFTTLIIVKIPTTSSTNLLGVKTDSGIFFTKIAVVQSTLNLLSSRLFEATTVQIISSLNIISTAAERCFSNSTNETFTTVV